MAPESRMVKTGPTSLGTDFYKENPDWRDEVKPHFDVDYFNYWLGHACCTGIASPPQD